MASNLANIGPLVIAVIRHFSHGSSAYEAPSILFIFIVGITIPFILSFVWSNTLWLFGQRRSFYLLICSFCLAFVNCTSSVTFLPFVNRFEPHYLNIYFGGEALSSLIPAFLGIIQGVGKKPECIAVFDDITHTMRMETKYYSPSFSVQIYLICLCGIMLISLFSFILLLRNKSIQHSKLRSTKKEIEEKMMAPDSPQSVLLEQTDVQVASTSEEKFSLQTIIYLGFILWISIVLIGCLPSINSFSLNPYGIDTFHYVIIACQFCYPLVSLVAALRPKLFNMPPVGIYFITLLGTIAFVYVFITAKLSPCSPLVDHMSGKWLISFVWIFIYIVFYYERISLANYINRTSGRRGLFWYGSLTQAGAFVGAAFIFILTLLNLFKERDVCLDYPCSKS
ncbi:unnamed protein product [Didymodactylos carnosus]|uniref:Riboflavin transporter n=1 Tax=Didymodactylos carnosus TaxID=1234261 RepID=A0A815C5R1_9BILA|nr:unnamed protein product [Didymodactylos carnosus]CAF4073495.1 unnamed protein product [Didymodactylos carnosus]